MIFIWNRCVVLYNEDNDIAHLLQHSNQTQNGLMNCIKHNYLPVLKPLMPKLIRLLDDPLLEYIMENNIAFLDSLEEHGINLSTLINKPALINRLFDPKPSSPSSAADATDATDAKTDAKTDLRAVFKTDLSADAKSKWHKLITQDVLKQKYNSRDTSTNTSTSTSINTSYLEYICINNKPLVLQLKDNKTIDDKLLEPYIPRFCLIVIVIMIMRVWCVNIQNS